MDASTIALGRLRSLEFFADSLEALGCQTGTAYGWPQELWTGRAIQRALPP
jgi:hypothetical protein